MKEFYFKLVDNEYLDEEPIYIKTDKYCADEIQNLVDTWYCCDEDEDEDKREKLIEEYENEFNFIFAGLEKLGINAIEIIPEIIEL